MPLVVNASKNGWFSPPGAYPFSLSPLTYVMAEGVLPRTATKVTAEVKADYGADIYLAVYSQPLLIGGDDNALIASASLTGVTSLYQTLEVEIPARVNLVSASVEQDGTITFTDGSATVAGSGTAFPMDGSWEGYEIQTKNGVWLQVESVETATSLTLTDDSTVTQSGEFYVRRPTPSAFVVRLWCSNLKGGAFETIARDTGVTDISAQSKVPGGIKVRSFTFE